MSNVHFEDDNHISQQQSQTKDKGPILEFLTNQGMSGKQATYLLYGVTVAILGLSLWFWFS